MLGEVKAGVLTPREALPAIVLPCEQPIVLVVCSSPLLLFLRKHVMELFVVSGWRVLHLQLVAVTTHKHCKAPSARACRNQVDSVKLSLARATVA